MKSIIEPHLALSAKVMDMQLERQNVVMGNLANITTPNYKPRRVEFENELKAALGLDARGKLAKTDEGHLPSTFEADKFDDNVEKEFKPRYVYGEDTVNLDKEMAIMQKNQLRYNTLVTCMQTGFRTMNKVITDGAK